MRIVYTIANLRIRLSSCVINALFCRAQLQPVGNHEVLRNWEEGGSVNFLKNKRLIKIHIVVYGLVRLDCISA